MKKEKRTNEIFGGIKVTDKQAEWADKKLSGETTLEWIERLKKESEMKSITVKRWKAKRLIKELEERGIKPEVSYHLFNATIKYRPIRMPISDKSLECLREEIKNSKMPEEFKKKFKEFFG